MDRRVIWAIVLMMIIAIVPTFIFKPPSRPVTTPSPVVTPADSGPAQSQPVARMSAPVVPAESIEADTGAVGDTAWASSPLYRYGFATVGGRLVSATLEQYKSMAPGERGQLAQLLRPSSNLFGLKLILGADTVRFDRWVLNPSTTSLQVTGPDTLRLSASNGVQSLQLTYSLDPDRYIIGVEGQIGGIGPNGGRLLVGMGPGLANTEADSNDNHRQLAVVTRASKAEATAFSKLKPGETTALDGPFDWVAVKSKYFVTAVLALDTTQPRISGATATPPSTEGKHPVSADVEVSLPIRPDGRFSLQLYAGPMEYERLARIGHDFDDVNPYGWPGFRTLIRPVAVAVRWLFVWMHQNLHLAYGIVLVLFGVLVRLILWPLNQKAMRASMAMQAIQPEMKSIQERYKNDPQKLQQEMFKLYREHGVNPFGGCWPLLIPMPVLFALFFVFGNTIELRGQAFLWLPDLARPDPYYVIPVLLGLSMYALNKIGQKGMAPNPQMKMMLYFMPIMMTVLFFPLASGLNLYYSVSNLASIPQQWMLAQERLKRKPPVPAPVPEKRKK